MLYIIKKKMKKKQFGLSTCDGNSNKKSSCQKNEKSKTSLLPESFVLRAGACQVFVAWSSLSLSYSFRVFLSFDLTLHY